MASAAHWHDVGGAVPGNYNPAATECWQEAVQIPPVRIVRDGKLDADVLAILQANTRLPDSLWGDLNGQLAALELGAKRLNGLLDEYGDDLVLAALGELRGRALRLMRSHIASLPDGRYSFEDLLDNDGIVNEPLTIALDMTVAGDRLLLDFSRTSAQCAGPVNISRATAVAACYVALKHLFPDVPANAGVLDAVDFDIPDRLVISAERPRPVGGYTETILRMIDVIFSAAAQADPTRAVAQAYGTINALSIAGHRSDKGREGQRWVMFSFFGGGHGGHSGGDGLSHGNAPISTATIPPLEILEAAYPVRFTEWSLRADSAATAGTAAASAPSTRSSCSSRTPRSSCSASAAPRRPRASRAAAQARSTCSATRTRANGTCRRWSRRCAASGWSAASACGSRRRAAAAGARPPSGPRRSARPTARWATRRPATTRTTRTRHPNELPGNSAIPWSSASTSAAPSPTCSCSTRRRARRASSRCRPRAARKRAAS